MDNKAITLIKTLLVVGVCAILVLVNIFLVRNYQARNRDAVRIADMAIIQSALNQYYTQRASYAFSTECKPGNVMVQPVCNDALQDYINLPEALSDPSGEQLLCDAQNCGVNPCQYTVGEDFTENSYRIYFTLEKGIEGLEAGCRYLDQDGLH